MEVAVQKWWPFNRGGRSIEVAVQLKCLFNRRWPFNKGGRSIEVSVQSEVAVQ